MFSISFCSRRLVAFVCLLLDTKFKLAVRGSFAYTTFEWNLFSCWDSANRRIRWCNDNDEQSEHDDEDGDDCDKVSLMTATFPCKRTGARHHQQFFFTFNLLIDSVTWFFAATLLHYADKLLNWYHWRTWIRFCRVLIERCRRCCHRECSMCFFLHFVRLDTFLANIWSAPIFSLARSQTIHTFSS